MVQTIEGGGQMNSGRRAYHRLPLQFLVAALVLNALPAAGAGDSPVAKFTWKMEQRYVDQTGDGFFDPSNSAGDVQDPFKVLFDGCKSSGGGSPIKTYRWKIKGSVYESPGCKFSAAFPEEGVFTVQLEVVTKSNGKDSTSQPVKVEDLLIVSIGDSIASGEGNPYETEYLINADARGNEIKIPKDATWEDERCHRSAVAGPAQAARHVESTSQKTSVTFVHLACSGASIADPIPDDDDPDGGLLDPYKGIEPEGDPMPPQVDQLKTLIGEREVDALMISIGANDMYFSKVVKDCLTNIFGCHKDNFDEGGVDTYEDAADIWEKRSPLLGPLYDRLRDRLEQPDLADLIAPENIFVTQYFDPTPGEDGETCDPLVDGLIDGDEASWASSTVVDGMNSRIKTKTEEFGWNFVSGITARYEGPPGHGYCAEPHWVVRLEESMINQADKEGSFHPCAQGHGAYRDTIVTSFIKELDPQIKPTTNGKGVVTGVKCTSPPEHFASNRDGDSIPFGAIDIPIPDVLDNCPNVPNPDQKDENNNKVGDACQGFTVNTTNDASDGDLTDGKCPDQCSLRAAMEQALDPTYGGETRITFAITDGVGPVFLGGARTISPDYALPQITAPLTFDASMQPTAGAFMVGARCAPLTGHPCVELSGAAAIGCGVPCSGLFFGSGSGGSSVKSMAINSWSKDGIQASPVPGENCATASGQHVFEGNHIGLDVTGRLDLGNGRHGISLDHSGGNRVGGSEGWQRNLISGNGVTAAEAEALNVTESAGSGISSSGACGGNNHVINNLIGTDITGTDAVGNSADGITLNSVSNQIGGTGTSQGNVISGNGGNGIAMFNSGDNVVQRNYIGTHRDGETAMPNMGDGIEIYDSFNNNLIGGPAGAGNIIAYNRRDGVNVYGGVGHSILSNSIHSNGSPKGLGINLQNGGVDHGEVTYNDEDDVDDGPNGMQNFPELLSVKNVSGAAVIEGRLSSSPSSSYTLQFFSSAGCDPSRYGEGELFIGSMNVSTGPDGEALFTATLAGALPEGRFVSATATDGSGNTSEFSFSHGLAGPCIGRHVVNSTGDEPDGELEDDACDTGSSETGFTGVCTLRAAIQESNHSDGKDRITFDVGNGPITLEPEDVLPRLTDPVVIDATTQPGFAGKPLVEIDGSGSKFPNQGLSVYTDDTTIKGFVINRFSDTGIVISGDRNKVMGNWIGLTRSGKATAPNNYGIWVDGSEGTVIGGKGPSARNVVSGNITDGITLYDGNVGTVVQGNYVGTDATGLKGLGNEQTGISVQGSGGATIGGSTSRHGNVIAANGRHGVLVEGDSTTISRNIIGLDKARKEPLGNLRNGIWVAGASSSDIRNNAISANGWSGVQVSGDEAQSNVIVTNAIFENVWMGIDLDDDGVAVNDPGDVDVGSNGLQNYPTIEKVTKVSSGTKIAGKLESAPGDYSVELFRNPTCHSTGHGEGRLPIATLDVSLTGDTATFTTTVPAELPKGTRVTATATGPGGTSEFSACFKVR